MKTIESSINVPADEAALQSEIQRYLNEIERSHERMQHTHQEIQRSKARTRAMLKELAELRIA